MNIFTRGNIEFVNPRQEAIVMNDETGFKEIVLSSDEPLLISGWILNDLDETVFDEISLYVDDKKYITKIEVIKPNVAELFGDKYLHSGFEFPLSETGWSDGEEHRVRVSGVTKDGIEVFINYDVKITIDDSKGSNWHEIRKNLLPSKILPKRIKVRALCAMGNYISIRSLLLAMSSDPKIDLLAIRSAGDPNLLNDDCIHNLNETDYDINSDKPDIAIIHTLYAIEIGFNNKALADIENINRCSKLSVGLPLGLLKVANVEHHIKQLILTSNDDTVVILDDYMFNEMKHSEILRPRIVNYGNPKFDGIFNRVQKKADVPDEWKKIIGKKVYLLTTDHMVFANNFTFDLYAQPFFEWFAEHRDECALIIRPHPLAVGELTRYGLWTKADYAEIVKYCQNSKNIIWDEYPDYTLSYSIADCVFTDVNCGIILSSLVINKPVCVLLRYDGRADEIMNPEIVRHHTVVSNPEELIVFFEQILNGEDPNYGLRQEAISKFISRFDGMNGQRIKEFILETYYKRFGKLE